MHPLTSDVSQISPEQLIKPLQQQPWNGQLRLESQVQRFPPVPWQNDMVQFSRTVMTEPNLNNQNMMMRRSVSRGGSDGVDSGYFSQAPTSGAHFSDPCSGNRKDLEQDFLTDHGKKFDIRRGDGYRPPATQSVVSDNVSSGRVSRKAPVSKCPVCERPARNASDARLVELNNQVIQLLTCCTESMPSPTSGPTDVWSLVAPEKRALQRSTIGSDIAKACTASVLQ